MAFPRRHLRGTSFTITSVSQTAGKAAGGTTVTVNGTGFVPSMLSALGVVTYVSATRVTIVTAGGAAGTIAWTLTKPGGGASVSPTQIFTYLALPTFLSISPSSGPETIGATGLLLGISNVPPVGSGCPVTLTLGSGAGSNISIVATATLTADFAATNVLGATNLTGTVDGVAITGGTGVYTSISPPVLTSMPAVGTSGGTTNLGGAAFVNGATAQINIPGTGWVTVSCAFSSVSLLVLTIPAEAVGNYDVKITNPDGQVTISTALLKVQLVDSPSTIFGADLKGWWIAGDASTVTSAGLVVSINDLSGNNSQLNDTGGAAGSINRPTYVASDPDYGGAASFSCVAANTQYLESYFGLTNSGNSYFLLGAMKVTAGASDTSPLSIGQTSGNHLAMLVNSSGVPRVLYSAGTATWTAGISGVPCIFKMGVTGNGGTSNTISVAINNQPEVTAAATATMAATGGNLVIGARDNSSSPVVTPATVTFPEVICVQRNATTAESLRYAKYLNSKYKVTPVPTVVTGFSKVPVSTISTTRITGTGYQIGVTVAVIVSGSEVSLTVTANGTTWIDVITPSLAAGSYDIVISNVDGNSSTTVGALTATASVNPLQIAGTSLIGWYEMDTLATTGGGGTTLTALGDQSGIGNNVTVGGTITYNPADANGVSASFDGATNYLLQASLNFATNGGAPALTTVLVVLPDASAPGQYMSCYGNVVDLIDLSAGAPRCSKGAGAFAVWGASIAGALRMVTGTTASGVNPTCTINVSNSGSPVSAGMTSVALSAGNVMCTGARDNGGVFSGFYKGKVYARYDFSTVLSAPQLASLKTYIQAKYPNVP